MYLNSSWFLTQWFWYSWNNLASLFLIVKNLCFKSVCSTISIWLRSSTRHKSLKSILILLLAFSSLLMLLKVTDWDDFIDLECWFSLALCLFLLSGFVDEFLLFLSRSFKKLVKNCFILLPFWDSSLSLSSDWSLDEWLPLFCISFFLN